MDDPNTRETPMLSWQERDSMILKTLDEHHIQAGLFVCGMRVDNAAGRILLKHWDSKNHLICNHSYSHFYFDSESRSCESFFHDFEKGDSIIRSCKNYTRLFRFPYLKEGNTVEKRDCMRVALKKNGYKNGYVTIDASDWYIDAQLTAALKKDLNTDLTPFKGFYVQHILNRANYYDSLAHLVFKNDIMHTLLIHHSLLNALFLNDLLIALKANGWTLIDAKKAYTDDAFQAQPDIVPCGEGFVWQWARRSVQISKSLRYPAEDGDYEKVPLENYLKEYKDRNIGK